MSETQTTVLSTDQQCQRPDPTVVPATRTPAAATHANVPNNKSIEQRATGQHLGKTSP